MKYLDQTLLFAWLVEFGLTSWSSLELTLVKSTKNNTNHGTNSATLHELYKKKKRKIHCNDPDLEVAFRLDNPFGILECWMLAVVHSMLNVGFVAFYTCICVVWYFTVLNARCNDPNVVTSQPSYHLFLKILLAFMNYRTKFSQLL